MARPLEAEATAATSRRIQIPRDVGWQMASAVMEALDEFEKVLHKIRVLNGAEIELDYMYYQMFNLTPTKPNLIDFQGLGQPRREAHGNTGGIQEEILRLNNLNSELQERFAILQKVIENELDGAAAAPTPQPLSEGAAASDAHGVSTANGGIAAESDAGACGVASVRTAVHGGVASAHTAVPTPRNLMSSATRPWTRALRLNPGSGLYDSRLPKRQLMARWHAATEAPTEPTEDSKAATAATCASPTPPPPALPQRAPTVRAQGNHITTPTAPPLSGGAIASEAHGVSTTRGNIAADSNAGACGVDPEHPAAPTPKAPPTLQPQPLLLHALAKRAQRGHTAAPTPPPPALLQQALAARAQWLSHKPRSSDTLDAREIADVMAIMRQEWLHSVVGMNGMNCQERKHAWQKYLHKTPPCCEKAIRLAVGTGIGDTELLLAIVHEDARRHTVRPFRTSQHTIAKGRQCMRRQCRRTETRGRSYLQNYSKCTACGSDGDLRTCAYCTLSCCEGCLPDERRNCWRCPETDHILDDGDQYRPFGT